VLACVISYTSKNASEFRLEDDQSPRYSSCPAVSVRESEYVVPSIVRVTEYESSIVGSYLWALDSRNKTKYAHDVLMSPLTAH
jgi:hypothetical protein